MSIRIRVAIALAVQIIAIDLAMGAATAYEFPGVRLGMSLAEFRKVAYPEAKGASVVCDGDAQVRDLRPSPELVATGEEASAGVQACGFYRYGRILGSLPPEWIVAPLRFGGMPVAATFWFIASRGGPTANRDADVGHSRLFRITLRTNVTGWDDVWREATSRYGAPTFTSREPFALAPRRSIDNLVATWDDGASTVVASMREDRPSRSTVRFLHKELNWMVQGRLAAQQ